MARLAGFLVHSRAPVRGLTVGLGQVRADLTSGLVLVGVSWSEPASSEVSLVLVAWSGQGARSVGAPNLG